MKVGESISFEKRKKWWYGAFFKKKEKERKENKIWEQKRRDALWERKQRMEKFKDWIRMKVVKNIEILFMISTHFVSMALYILSFVVNPGQATTVKSP